MSTETHKIEAVLTATDGGFTYVFRKAADETQGFEDKLKKTERSASTFKDTMMGMIVAQGVMKGLSAAWNLVRNSVDSAMKRIDTMDRFNRTIQLMTGDSEKAAEAVEKINVAARGTPYGLDVMSRAVQGLVTAAIDVDDAIKYIEGWGDAVAMFGDGTNTAMEQAGHALQKMASRGKIQMMEINSLVLAGIPVMEMYAEATGQSVDDIRDTMSKGKLSTKEFLAGMDKAFQHGTKSFPSLTGAAKKAGTTWAGTFDNMRAATTRGVKGIIDKIEEARREVGLPTMKETVANFGKTMEKILLGIGDVLGFVAKHFEKFAIAGGTALGTLLAFKGAEAVYSVISKITGATQLYTTAIKTQAGAEGIKQAAQKLGIALNAENLTQTAAGAALSDYQQIAILKETGALGAKSAATGLATKAQMGLNAAMAANPIGFVIASIAALVGVITLLVNIFGKLSPEQQKAVDKAKEVGEAFKASSEAIESSKKAYGETSKEIKGNAERARDLVKQIKDIESSSEKAATKKAKLRGVVEKLNTLYPELNVELTEFGTNIKGGTEAIENNIKIMEEMARSKALQKHLDETYEEIYKIEFGIDELKAGMAEMEEAGEAWKTTTYHIRGTVHEVKKMKTGYKAYVDQLAESEAALAKHRATIEGINVKYDEQAQKEYDAKLAAEEHARSIDVLRETYGEAGEAILTYSDIHGEEMDKVYSTVKETAYKYDMSMKQVMEAVRKDGSTIEEWAKKHEQAHKDVQSAFDTYVTKTLDGWSKIKQGSAIGIDEYIANMKHNQKAVEQWSTNIQILMKAGVDQGVIEQLAKLGPEGAAQAQKFVDELTKLNGGALGKYDELKDGAKAKIDEIAGVMETGVKIAYDATETAILSRDLRKLTNQQLDNMIKAVESKYATFKNLGYNIGSGVYSGLASYEKPLENLSRRMMVKVEQTMKSTMKVKSPSDVTTEIGEQTGEGYYVGIKNLMNKIKDASRQLAFAVLPSSLDIRHSVDAGVKATASAAGATSAQPLSVILRLGDRDFRAFAADINSVNGQALELVEVFG